MSSVAMPESTLRALAALPVATDEEAEAVTPPKLGLTDADIARLHALAEAVAEARCKATDAEQAHTRASHAALRLPELQRRAGEVAAAAFAPKANGREHAAAADITQKIEAAKRAASAAPVLERQLSLARDRVSDARGALHRATTECLQAVLARCAARWSELALEMTRVAAAAEAAVNALPEHRRTNATAGWALCSLKLSVPALPAAEFGVPLDKSAVDCGFTSALLAPGHPRLHAHSSAAAGWLNQQLCEALAPSGFTPRSLLR